MRDIRFRAWDKDNHQWLDLLYLAFAKNGTVMSVNTLDGGIYGLHEVELTEYTGLKDKNGKESYFDDVLRWQDSTFRVVWDSECACVMLKRLTGSDGMKEIPAHNIKDSEIIGSIYESSHLLDKG